METKRVHHASFLIGASALLLLFSGCEKGPTSNQVPVSPSDGALRVALVRHKHMGDLTTQIASLTTKIQRISSDLKGRVDVVVTPEYSLTSSLPSNYADYAIDVACDNEFDNCILTAGGGLRSGEVLAAMEVFRTMAVAGGFYLFLGTVIERFDASSIAEIPDAHVYFNDLVIIDPQGRTSIKRKTSNDWGASCRVGDPCGDAIEAEALRTVRNYVVTTHGSRQFDVFPIICSERTYAPMLTYAVERGLLNLDMVIGPEREGDLPYEGITEAIQSSTWTPNTLGWEEFKRAFVTSFVLTGIVRPDAFVAASDGASGGAGLINLTEPPMPANEYVRNSDYMFGAIEP